MRVTFDRFVLDTATRELTRAGEAVHLQPKAFDLLVYLVTHRNRVVPKDELVATLWGRVVTPGVLPTALKLLRRALDDDAKAPRFVRTVHGTGYRFVHALQTATRTSVSAFLLGRDEELSALYAFRESEKRAFCLGGIAGAGKSALLDRWAEELGGNVLWLTGAILSCAPQVLEERVKSAMAAAPTKDIVIIDNYEELYPVDEWFRRAILPELGPRKLVVAVRGDVPVAWQRNPNFDHLTLEGLPVADAAKLLENAGSTPHQAELLAHRFEGHALSVRLLEQLAPEQRLDCAEGGRLALPELARRFAESAPSEAHRQALDVMVLVSALTLEHLEYVLDAPARLLFDWLAGLPFVHAETSSLRMHGAASSALLSQLIQDAPKRFAPLHQRAITFSLRELRAATSMTQRIEHSTQAMFLMRMHPAIAAMYDPRAAELSLTLADEHEDYLQVVEAKCGAGTETIFRRWLEDTDDAQLWAIRDGEEFVGGILVITSADDAYDFDPAVTAIRQHLRSLGREDAVVRIHRQMVSIDGEKPGPGIQRCHDVLNINHNTMMDGEVRDSFVIYREPELWRELVSSMDFAEVSSFDLDGAEHAVFHRHFADGTSAWVERVVGMLYASS